MQRLAEHGRFGRVMEEVRSRGVLGASRHFARRLLQPARRLDPNQRRWRRELEERDRCFDEQWGVDTGGYIEPGALGISSGTRRFAVAYVASSPEEFARTLNAAPIDHKEFVFIDFGSGKGRAVLMATEFPFKKVIGVEFSPRLHDIARRNLAASRAERRCGAVELVCADAVTWPLPDEPLACYFYNPFQREVMEAVINNLRESFERRPRPIYLLYSNPVEEAVLARQTFLERVAKGDLFAVYRVRLPEQSISDLAA